jgi:hypothetical protein
LKDKFKAIFDIINKQQEGDFMKKQIWEAFTFTALWGLTSHRLN